MYMYIYNVILASIKAIYFLILSYIPYKLQ